MRRLIVTGVFLLSVLVLVGKPSSNSALAQATTADRPQPAQEVAEQEGLQTAQVLVMIVGNPLHLGDTLNSLDSETRTNADTVLLTLIRGTYLRADKPAEEYRRNPVSFRHLSVTPDGHTLGILWASGHGDMAKVVAAAERRLQEALLEIHRRSLDPLDRKMALAERRMVQAEQMTQRVTQELQDLRQQALRSGQALEPQDIQLFSSVKRDNLAMRAELAGLQAQREAIIEQIAKAKARLDAAQTPQQAVLDELAMVVKLKEQELAQMQTLFKKGFVTQAELAKGEVALAQAKADLVDRRRTLVQEAGGGQLGRLNEQLVETQIAITTTEARLKETHKALEELERSAYNPVNSLVIEYQRTRRALDSAWAEEEAAAAELARLKMARDAIPAPKVIAIGQAGKPK
ncbi:MAG: HlyD family secretion protein [Planctomycetota bacterium]|jgi:hypothetical protein